MDPMFMLTSTAKIAIPAVERILRGAKPADLPVQKLTNFELQLIQPAEALGCSSVDSTSR